MLTIREGKPEDHLILSELMMLVIRQMDLPLMKKIGPVKLQNLFDEFYIDHLNVCQQVAVAELDGEVVGAAFGFPDEQEECIDEAFDELLNRKFGIQQGFEDTEAFKDEWYLDTVAVFEWIQGKGIGKQLLQFLPTIAKKQRKTCIGLNVDEANPGAKKLYESIGFKETDQVRLGTHNYIHMRWDFD